MKKRTQTIAFAIPDRTNFVLGAMALSLVVVYVLLMATTIFFATLETQLARGIDNSRARIHFLETEYYGVIAKIDSTDPYSVGLVAPSKIEYVVEARMPGLSFSR